MVWSDNNCQGPIRAKFLQPTTSKGLGSTVTGRYLGFRVDEHLPRSENCSRFTTLDLSSGYRQLPIAEVAMRKIVNNSSPAL